MNKEQFLNELFRRLKGLPYNEVEGAMHFYEEYFAEAGPENEQNVISELGSPEHVASKIIGEYAINDAEAPPQAGKKKGVKAIWVALIALCASPVAFPLAIAAFVLIISLLATVFSVVVSFAAAGIAITAAGLACFGIGIAALALSFATGIYFMGMGLVCMCGGVLLLYGMVKLFAVTIKGIQRLVGKMLVRRSRHENMA